MKRALIVAAALILLMQHVSIAQPDQEHGRPNAAPARPAERPAPRPAPPNRPAPPQPQAPRPQPPRGQPPRGQPPTAQPYRPQQPRPHEARPMPPRPQPGRPASNVSPLPPRGNQFWHRGQYYNRIRGPAFAYPPGWGYRQWTIGARRRRCSSPRGISIRTGRPSDCRPRRQATIGFATDPTCCWSTSRPARSRT